MRYDRLLSLSATFGLLIGVGFLIGSLSIEWLGWIPKSIAEMLVNFAFAVIVPAGFIKILEWTEESPDEQRMTETALAELKQKWTNQANANNSSSAH